MKMYICVPAVPRPFNVVPVANVRSIDHAADIVRAMNVIRIPVYDHEPTTNAFVITSDNPDEPFTFVVAPDDMSRDDLSHLFDATPDNVYP